MTGLARVRMRLFGLCSKVVWNTADEAVAREIMHRNLCFRASLGPERRGPDGFIDYRRSIHRALARLRSRIAFIRLDGARMSFSLTLTHHRQRVRR